MYSFLNDYSEGAHPRILAALAEGNLRPCRGYGLDPICAEAADLIRQQCAAPGVDVHFVVGGTQANLLVIHALLRSYEAVIAAETGHVAVHETGAIETTGHKVCAVPSPDGKLTPELIRSALSAHSSEHMVAPRLVYLSETTEVGTLYTRSELEAIRRCCEENGLLLYIDGARLGSALTAPGNDLTLPDIAALADVFTIGGTKNGALFGEAVVFARPQPGFRWYEKQRGAMLAKGWLLGLQFRELLSGGLYFELARHANEQAARLRAGLEAGGCELWTDSRSNQLFPLLPSRWIGSLQKDFLFDVNQPADGDRTCVRLVTSWATPDEPVDAFLRAVSALR